MLYTRLEVYLSQDPFFHFLSNILTDISFVINFAVQLTIITFDCGFKMSTDVNAAPTFTTFSEWRKKYVL